ncbi:dsRBD fold-containing protein [Streptomyces griseoluteus]
MPEIGDEPAAGRAVHELAHQLLNAVDRDVRGMAPSCPSTPQEAGRPK